MIAGIILAAGASERMGAPKALLELDGQAAIARSARSLHEGGCTHLVAVLGADADAVRGALPRGVTPLIHARWADGRTSSVKAGLSAVREAEAVVLAPVDRPLFAATDVRALLGADKPMALPVHEGERGHPLMVRQALFQEILALKDDEPLHGIIHRDAQRVAEVATTNPGVLVNLDTPQAHRDAVQAMRRWPLA